MKKKVYSIRVFCECTFPLNELTKTLKQAGIIANYNNHYYTSSNNYYEVTISLSNEEQRILAELMLIGRHDCELDTRYGKG